MVAGATPTRRARLDHWHAGQLPQRSIEKILREGVRVRFAMPAHTIRLPDGQGYRLDQLLLTLPAGSTITVDKKLRFRATLAGGADPAVSSVVLPGGNIRVIIVTSTALAELLE